MTKEGVLLFPLASLPLWNQGGKGFQGHLQRCKGGWGGRGRWGVLTGQRGRRGVRQVRVVRVRSEGRLRGGERRHARQQRRALQHERNSLLCSLLCYLKDNLPNMY